MEGAATDIDGAVAGAVTEYCDGSWAGRVVILLPWRVVEYCDGSWAGRVVILLPWRVVL
jgi:hypothetical protein